MSDDARVLLLERALDTIHSPQWQAAHPGSPLVALAEQLAARLDPATTQTAFHNFLAQAEAAGVLTPVETGEIVFEFTGADEHARIRPVALKSAQAARAERV